MHSVLDSPQTSCPCDMRLPFCFIPFNLLLAFFTWYSQCVNSRSLWPSGLRRVSVAAHLLRLWVLTVVSVVYCWVEVSATSWSLVQGSPTDCGVSVWSRNLVNEEALAHWGAVAPKTNNKQTVSIAASSKWCNCPATFLFYSFYEQITWFLAQPTTSTRSLTARLKGIELLSYRAAYWSVTRAHTRTHTLTYIQIFLLLHSLVRIAIYYLYAISRTKSEWKKHNTH